MLRFILPSFLLLGFLLLVGCEKENFDVVEENPEVVTPVVVETEEEANNFFLKTPGGETIGLKGQGAISANGAVVLTTSATTTIQCSDSTFSVDFAGDDPGFWMVLFGQPDPVVLFAAAESVPELSNAFVRADCETVPTTLEITAFTDSRIAGRYTTEFFTDPDNTGLCEDYTNLGVIEIVFDVALTPCQ